MSRGWMLFTAGLLVGAVLTMLVSHGPDGTGTASAGERGAADADGPRHLDRPLPADKPHRAKVLTVEHGDEFSVLWRPPVPVEFSVRLANVDTPYADQGHGEQAREALSQLVYGEQVDLHFENPDDPLQDRSNRLIAYVTLTNGESVNVKMVATGWAEHMTRFGRGPLYEQLAAAAEKARAEQRGKHGVDAE